MSLPRVTVASYALDASPREREKALRRGLVEVIAELIELGLTAGDVLDQCEVAVDQAVEDDG